MKKNIQRGLLRPAYIRDTIPQNNLIPKSNSYLMKNILLFIILIISFSNVYGQSTLMWTKTYYTGWDDANHDVIQTYDKGYMTINNYPHNVMKIDSLGNIEWTKTYPFAGIKKVQQTNDSGYIMLGSFSNTGIRILRTDKNGDTLWTKLYGNNYNNKPMPITFKKIRDGGYILLGSRIYDQYYSGEVYIAKIDTLGNLLWQNTYRDSINTIAYDIIESNTGTFFITGTTWNNYFNPEKSYYFLGNIDIDGKMEWLINYISNQHKLMGGGNILELNGYIFISGVKDSSIFQINIIFLSKIDTNGIKLWEKSYPSGYGGGKMILSQNNYFVSSDGYQEKITFTKIDLNGNINLFKLINPIEEETNSGNSIANTIDNGFIIFGQTTYGWRTPASLIGVKTDSMGNYLNLIGISNNEEIIKDFYIDNIYPNPFNSVCNVKFYNNNNQNLIIRIYDAMGKEIFYENKFHNKGFKYIAINSDIVKASGIYFIVIENNKYKLSKKFIHLK